MDFPTPPCAGARAYDLLFATDVAQDRDEWSGGAALESRIDARSRTRVVCHWGRTCARPDKRMYHCTIDARLQKKGLLPVMSAVLRTDAFRGADGERVLTLRHAGGALSLLPLLLLLTSSAFVYLERPTLQHFLILLH